MVKEGDGENKMAKTLKERRESSVVTLDDAVRLIFRSSKSKSEILGKSDDASNQHVVPILDSKIFGALHDNIRMAISAITYHAAIAAYNDLPEEKISRSVVSLMQSLYSPSASASSAAQSHLFGDYSHIRWFNEVEGDSIFWQCIDYLAKIDHPARFDVLVNRNARTKTEDFNGVKVKSAFYTAASRDGWNYGEPVKPIDFRGHFLVNTSPNHAETFLVEGAEIGLIDEPRVIVRTGNGIAGIKPSIRAVDKAGRINGYAAYQTRGLPNEVTEPIMRKLGLEEGYRRFEEMAIALGRR